MNKDSMQEPVVVMKQALDVTPHYHGIWCSIEEGELFINDIELRKWSEDGQQIVFMLGTHNFMRAQPDEDIRVVEIEPNVSDSIKELWAEQDRKSMGERPRHCRCCGQDLLHVKVG